MIYWVANFVALLVVSLATFVFILMVYVVVREWLAERWAKRQGRR